MGHLKVIPDEFSQAWFLLRQEPLGPQDLARFWTCAPVQGQRQLSVQLVGGHLGSERMMNCTVVCPVSLESDFGRALARVLCLCLGSESSCSGTTFYISYTSIKKNKDKTKQRKKQLFKKNPVLQAFCLLFLCNEVEHR